MGMVGRQREIPERGMLGKMESFKGLSGEDLAKARIIQHLNFVNYELSLECKENVDFLLTPALLMQEAISDDIILTYPSE